MKIRFDKVGYPLYCDVGPYEGDMGTDLSNKLYLAPEEYARYEGSESLQITLQENGDGRLGTGNTTEPSGNCPPATRHPPPARSGPARANARRTLRQGTGRPGRGPAAWLCGRARPGSPRVLAVGDRVGVLETLVVDDEARGGRGRAVLLAAAR